MASLSSCDSRCCRLMSVGGFQVLEFVADFSRPFVIFALDGFVESALETFAGREGAFGPNFLEPILERLNFGAVIGSVTTGMFTIKISNLFESFFDLLNCQSVVLGFKSLGTAS